MDCMIKQYRKDADHAAQFAGMIVIKGALKKHENYSSRNSGNSSGK
jgi:hypothetical protein